MRWLCLLILAAPVAAQDLLVLTPKEFEPALAKWKAWRASHGISVAVQQPAADLPAQVRALHKKSGGKLRFVLLLGDVKTVPCAYRNLEIIRVWERDPRAAHDNDLADLDGDDLPDLAVGRLPADNLEEAKRMLAKVVAYEANRDFGAWRRRVALIGGVGGFGRLQDFLIEQGAVKFLKDNLPVAYDLHVTYCNENSPFCPPPSKVTEVAVERFNEGALMWTYMGHGSRNRLDRLKFQDQQFDILIEDDVYSMNARKGPPIVFFNACSTGHFDGAPDCLAEVAVKHPGGPIAVLASSRVSMPYANGVLAKELLEAMFTDQLPTFGECLVQAKRRMVEPKENDKGRQMIETMAFIGYQRDAKLRKKERTEHLFLYNLIGDPSMRLPHPQKAVLDCAKETRAGVRLTVKGESPVAGKATVEIVAERTPFVVPRKGDTDADFAECYARANARTKARVTVDVKKGAFATELPLPEGLPPGTYYLRVWVEGADGAAMGARVVKVTK